MARTFRREGALHQVNVLYAPLSEIAGALLLEETGHLTPLAWAAQVHPCQRQMGMVFAILCLTP